MSDKKSSLKRTIIGGGASVLILAIAGFILFNQQYVKDQLTVWSYTPSSDIRTVEERIDFSGKGTFYFYATKPEIDGSEQFNADCPRQEVGNPILGCYSAGRIYVYDVTDTQLDGIEEVTAAHEMLHAVWERMSGSDQARIGSLLRAQYQSLSADTDLKERMDYYERTEPGEFENELHSILGTEVKTLSSELEAYYSQYFTDRQKVIKLHDSYNSVFESLRQQSTALYAELTTLSASIESRTAQYDADVTKLSADISSFNARAKEGSFSSISQFNTERAALVKRSSKVDADRASISADIAVYNTKYDTYQQVASQIETLNKSIDSFKTLQPTPAV